MSAIVSEDAEALPVQMLYRAKRRDVTLVTSQ